MYTKFEKTKSLSYRGGDVILVTALHDAESIRGLGAQVVPLGVPGFDYAEDDSIEDKILSACMPFRPFPSD